MERDLRFRRLYKGVLFLLTNYMSRIINRLSGWMRTESLNATLFVWGFPRWKGQCASINGHEALPEYNPYSSAVSICLFFSQKAEQWAEKLLCGSFLVEIECETCVCVVRLNEFSAPAGRRRCSTRSEALHGVFCLHFTHNEFVCYSLCCRNWIMAEDRRLLFGAHLSGH